MCKNFWPFFVLRVFVSSLVWLHVWGGIGHYFKTELYFFEENLTSSLYQKIISQRLPPSTTSPDCPKRVKNYYFVQDNDPKHKTKASMKLLEEITQGRMYKHPPNSPDLNVMEDAWSYLDRCVKESRVKTISGLKQKLKNYGLNILGVRLGHRWIQCLGDYNRC